MISNPIIRWLLGIDTAPHADGVVRIGWEMPLAGWVWLIGISGAMLLAWLAYLRMTPRVWTRRALIVLRASILLLMLVLVARPVLEFVEELREADRVLVLLDRSKSLQLADWRDDQGTLRTRDEQLRDAVTHIEPGGRNLAWFSFSDGFKAAQPDAIGSAEGSATDIPLALDEALRRSGTIPVGGVIILSDGRSTRPIDARLTRSLAARSVPVYAVALGSPDPLADASIVDIRVPARAFARDQVPVTVRIQPLPGAASTLELIDATTGAVLDRAVVPAGPASNQVLVASTGTTERLNLKVRLNADADDAVPANNERAATIEIIDRAVRLLMVEGAPRWEYRYIKNLLVREPSMESSIMLLSADRDFVQEGNMAVTRIPSSREEFDLFDVFVIGDVAGSQFSALQLDELRRAVTERGAGLLLIGGERAMPTQWIGTPIEDLFPMRLSTSMQRQPEPVAMEPTELATGLGLLRLGDGADHWPQELGRDGPVWSKLQWVQSLQPVDLKPTAEVLATVMGATSDSIGAGVVSMRFGAGQVVYVATDETWRWRNGIGEAYQERFWIQLVRFLSRAGLSAAATGAELTVEPSVVTTGQTATIRLDVVDEQLQRRLPDTLEATITRSTQPSERLRLTTDAATRDALVVGLAGVWQPRQAGEHEVTVTDPALGGTLTRRVTVVEPNDELAHPDTDHAALESLCSATGGRLLAIDDLAQLERVIPDRSTFSERVDRVPIWASPLALMVLVMLCGLEWAGRRMVRLA